MRERILKLRRQLRAWGRYRTDLLNESRVRSSDLTYVVDWQVSPEESKRQHHEKLALAAKRMQALRREMARLLYIWYWREGGAGVTAISKPEPPPRNTDVRLDSPMPS